VLERGAGEAAGGSPTWHGNDFAAGLGIPDDVAAALEVALSGEPRAVDVGRVNGRYFLNVSTGGFGASASEEAPAGSEAAAGRLGVRRHGSAAVRGAGAAQARFVVPAGVAYEGDVLLFAVGNAKRTGGGNLLTPRAR
jgi:diacylglycerol kinase (ATP)